MEPDAAQCATPSSYVMDAEETCVRYIEDTLSDEEASMHLYCVDMYQWLYPTITANKGLMQEIPQSYRHQDLNSWINGKKSQEKMIKKKLEDIAKGQIRIGYKMKFPMAKKKR